MLRYSIRKARQKPNGASVIGGLLLGLITCTPIGLPIVLGAAGVAAAADVATEVARAAAAESARRREAQRKADDERRYQLSLAEERRKQQEAEAEEARRREEERRTKPARDAAFAAAIREVFRRRVALVLESDLEEEDKAALINDLRDRYERKLREVIG